MLGIISKLRAATAFRASNFKNGGQNWTIRASEFGASAGEGCSSAEISNAGGDTHEFIQVRRPATIRSDRYEHNLKIDTPLFSFSSLIGLRSRDSGRIKPTANAKFAQDRRDMVLHRLDLQVKVLRNFFISEAAGQAAEDLHLACG